VCNAGQTVGWIKLPLGIEIGLGSGDIVLDGDPAPPRKGAQQPSTFRPTLLWHGRPSQQLLSCCCSSCIFKNSLHWKAKFLILPQVKSFINYNYFAYINNVRIPGRLREAVLIFNPHLQTFTTTLSQNPTFRTCNIFTYTVRLRQFLAQMLLRK